MMNTVLLVEDEPAIRLLYTHNLERAGFTVMLAGDGMEACNVLERVIPSAILSDISMPRMDGFAFREYVHANDRFRAIPFIFLTAHPEEEDVLRALEMGADDYISKIVSPVIVATKLKGMIERKSLHASAAVREVADATRRSRLQLTPDEPPVIDGYAIAQWSLPSHGVPGGDCFDYIQLTDHTWLILLGDVIGKRWKAWMFVGAYLGYIRSTVRALSSRLRLDDATPSALLAELNRFLVSDERHAEILCALTVGILDTHTHSFVIAGSGGLPLLRLQKADRRIDTHAIEGPVLGLHKDGHFESRTISFEIGDKIILCTDGLPEAENLDTRQLGWTTMMNSMHRCMDASAEETIRRTQRLLEAHTAPLLPQDDVTMLVIERTGTGERRSTSNAWTSATVAET